MGVVAEVRGRSKRRVVTLPRETRWACRRRGPTWGRLRSEHEEGGLWAAGEVGDGALVHTVAATQNRLACVAAARGGHRPPSALLWQVIKGAPWALRVNKKKRKKDQRRGQQTKAARGG